MSADPSEAATGRYESVRTACAVAMSILRRLVSLALSVVCLVGTFPVSAFAVSTGIDPSDASVRVIVDSYGYTAPGVTVGTLATDLRISRKATIALVGLVDQWATGNQSSRLTAQTAAGAAAAAHAYMQHEGTWDTFAEKAENMSILGGEAILDATSLWGMLGLRSLATDRSFPTTTSAGTAYSSGFATVHSPAITPRITPPAGSLTATEQARAVGIMYNPGYFLKLSGPLYYGTPPDYERFWYTDSFAAMCANCGWRWAYPWQVSPAHFWLTYSAWGWPAPVKTNVLNHVCSTAIVSEAAYSNSLKLASGLPGYLSFAAGAVTDPLYTVAALLDDKGIPGVLPPGMIHRGSEWGDGLISKAASMVADAANMLPGYSDIVKAIASLLEWMGKTMNGFSDQLISWFVPSPDVGTVIVPDEQRLMHEYIAHQTIASMFFDVADALDTMSSSSSGSGSLLAFSIAFPGGRSLGVDLRESVVAPLAPYRGYFSAALWLAYLVFLWRFVRIKPKLFQDDGAPKS